MHVWEGHVPLDIYIYEQNLLFTLFKLMMPNLGNNN